jgi:hypothetical protein
MTKSDLKTGMLVQTRDGDIGLVIKKLDIIIFKRDYMNISDYKEDLSIDTSSAQILKISEQLCNDDLTVYNWTEETVDNCLLWERKEQPKETIKIGEVTYDKLEFEQAVKNLKPINK